MRYRVACEIYTRRNLKQKFDDFSLVKETRSSQSIKIGIDLLIDKSIKIGKSDLIAIDCIDQSVEIDDTPFSFTDFMQTVNLLTIELQLRLEGSNNLLLLF